MIRPTKSGEGVQITRTVPARAGKGWESVTASARWDDKESAWRCSITMGPGKGEKSTTLDWDPTVELSNMIERAIVARPR